MNSTSILENNPNEGLREQFWRQGFCIVENLLDSAECDTVLEALFCTSQRYLDEGLAWQTERPWFEPRYHQALRNLRKSSPKSFSQIYDSMQANAALLSATLKPSILDIAGDILGVRDFELSTTSPMLRMDPPFDQRNSLDWHQERSY